VIPVTPLECMVEVFCLGVRGWRSEGSSGCGSSRFRTTGSVWWNIFWRLGIKRAINNISLRNC
jgi:hypothetical protein